MNVNHVAFATTTVLGVVTIGATVAAATSTASTVAMVAYATLALLSAAVSIASMTAWAHEDSTTVEKYFTRLQEHAGFAIVGSVQLVAQTLFQALRQGLAEGVGTRVRRGIAGPDHTYQAV